ncbi:MAG: NAD(+) diphosphatase [Pseudomonadota bacterium]
MIDAEAVTFAGATLDRAAHLRSDPIACEELLCRNDARCLPYWHLQPLTALEENERLSLGWLNVDHPVFGTPSEGPIFLGFEEGAPRFASSIPDWADLAPEENVFASRKRTGHPALPERYAFTDLRSVMADLGPEDAGNATLARGLFAWHATHGFCAQCGAQSNMDAAGWRRSCPACKAQHFPRTDPVVIMLVVKGNNVLLGRSPAWPDGMYSLLAGFVEPGETIEAAVRRETFEETGIRVGNVKYLSSQPWPFPSSLMIGCYADAISTEICLDPHELENAIWLSREDALRALSGGLPEIRPARRGSIARFLIEHWVADRLG